MRRVLLLVWVLCTSACAWGPGMYMDEGALRERHADKADTGTSAEFKVLPIDVDLLNAQQKARLGTRPAPLQDPLAEFAANYNYRVTAHDVLSVIVWDHPELTIPAGEFRSAEATGHPVSTDGTMFFPYAGILQVAGKTLPEIRELLADRRERGRVEGEGWCRGAEKGR